MDHGNNPTAKANRRNPIRRNRRRKRIEDKEQLTATGAQQNQPNPTENNAKPQKPNPKPNLTAYLNPNTGGPPQLHKKIKIRSQSRKEAATSPRKTPHKMIQQTP